MHTLLVHMEMIVGIGGLFVNLNGGSESPTAKDLCFQMVKETGHPCLLVETVAYCCMLWPWCGGNACLNNAKEKKKWTSMVKEVSWVFHCMHLSHTK
jgi:hypothetical protein